MNVNNSSADLDASEPTSNDHHHAHINHGAIVSSDDEEVSDRRNSAWRNGSKYLSPPTEPPPQLPSPTSIVLRPLAGVNNNNMSHHVPFRNSESVLSTQTSVSPSTNGQVDFVPLSEFDAPPNFDGTAGTRAPTTTHFVKGHGFFLSRKQIVIASIIILALLITILGLAIGLGTRGSRASPAAVVILNNKTTTNSMPPPAAVSYNDENGDAFKPTTTTEAAINDPKRESRIVIANNDDNDTPPPTTTMSASGGSEEASTVPTTTESLDEELDQILTAPIQTIPPPNGSVVLEAYVNGTLITTSTTTPTPTTDVPDANMPDNRTIRLPLTFIPKHYNLELRPLLEPEFTFSGTVEIDMVSSPNASLMTDRIVMHAKDINIDKQKISVVSIANEQQDAAPKALRVVNVTSDPDRDFLIIQLSETVSPNMAYRVALNFSGSLDKDLSGIYLSSYNTTAADGTNTTHWLMASQMEPTDARRVFPMFDEPALKATFNVTIIHDKKLTALCNMPQLQSPEPHPTLENMVIDRFVPTPPMSTYLLAFVLTDFPHIEQNTTNGTLVRMWARPDIVNSAQFALDLSVQLVDYFERYFQMSYPLKILDQVAVPDMYTAGMENWGLILYQEDSLIYNDNINAASHRKTILGTIAHEIAHQWFGNLVSPAWWDDLWLNEGFATYVQYVGGNRMRPQWHYMNDFLITEMQDSMQKDCLRTTHPIRVPVYRPDEISEIFDEVTYGKGAAMLRMMRHFLGETMFSRGVNAYLRQFAYGTATQDDLWNQLTTTAREAGYANIDVQRIMNSWTLQPGMPVVHVMRRNNSESGEQIIQVSQERFLLLDNATISNHSNYPQSWHIPLTIMPQTSSEPLDDISSVYNYSSYSLNGHAQTIWVTEPIMTLSKSNAAQSIPPSLQHWYLANVLQSGYFRVNYDHSNWHLLLGQLVRSPTVIHVANRAQLVDDAFNLARAGYLASYDIPLGMVRSYLPDETDYLPWQAAMNNLEHIDFMLRTTPDYDALRDLMLRVLLPVTNRLDLWNITSTALTAKIADNDTAPIIPDIALIKLRTLIYQASCYFDLPECITHAKALFNTWMVQYEGSKQANANLTAANPVPVDFKRTVYATAVRLGGVAEWDFAWEQYTIARNPLEQQVLLQAMAATREPWLIRRYLRLALDEQQIKRSHVMTVFGAVAMSSETGRQLAWEMFAEEWPTIRLRFAETPFSLPDAVEAMLNGANTLEALEIVKNFTRDYEKQLGTAKQAFAQGLETLQANVDWMRDSKNKIVLWLQIASAFSQAAAAFIVIKANNA